MFSILLGLLGTSLALYSIWLQRCDKPNIRIREFWPSLFSLKSAKSKIWKNNLEYVRLEIENTGNRIAYDVSALVIFPGLDALPMFPIIDGVISPEHRFFDLRPKQRLELIGAWSHDPSYYSDEHLSMTEFLKNGVPATARVNFGDKKIVKTLSKKEVEAHFQKHQESNYRFSELASKGSDT